MNLHSHLTLIPQVPCLVFHKHEKLGREREMKKASCEIVFFLPLSQKGLYIFLLITIFENNTNLTNTTFSLH